MVSLFECQTEKYSETYLLHMSTLLQIMAQQTSFLLHTFSLWNPQNIPLTLSFLCHKVRLPSLVMKIAHYPIPDYRNIVIKLSHDGYFELTNCFCFEKIIILYLFISKYSFI
jgi:hypothetical protein